MKLRTIPFLLFVGATLVASVSPALAWWQFVALGPDGERQVSARFKTEKECIAALKATEARLEKKYPDPERFPLVGSCEEYR
ncbi:MAG: hypothetical protein WBD95_02180 [Xanthobacteraceae bacterium]